MSLENRVPVHLRNFAGGWNTRDDPMDLREDQLASSSQNARILPSKTVVIPGYSKVNSSARGTSLSGKGIFDGKNHVLVAWSDGSVDRLAVSTGTFTNIAAAATMAGTLVDFTSYNGLDILVDGTNVKKWDGTTFANLAGSPPAASMVEVFQNHVFLGGLAGANASQLRFSDQETAETWTATNLLNIEKDTKEIIAGLIADFDRLIVFKSKSIHHILGFGINTFERIPASRGVGTTSNASIVLVKNSPAPQWNGMYWIDQGGIYFSSDYGVTPVRISDAIQPDFDALDQTDLDNAVAINVRGLDAVFFSLRTTSNSYNDRVFVWDYRLGTWWPKVIGMNFAAFAELSVSGEFRSYALEANTGTGGFVYRLNNGTSFAGSAISFQVQTKQFDFTDLYEQKKVFRKVISLHDVVSGSDLSVAPTFDFDSSAQAAKTISMTTNIGEAWYNNMIKAAQLVFSNSDLDARTGIRKITLEFREMEKD